MAQPPLPKFRKSHVELVRSYADRHFTDPGAQLVDVAIFFDLSERTLRESLRVNNTSWRAELQRRRLDRAEVLLKTTPYRVAEVARLSGYASAPAFAKAFREQFRLTPSQFRRGAGGRARAGGPTGASFHAGRRARGERVESRQGTGLTPGQRAIEELRLAETAERISDMDDLENHWPRRYEEDELRWRRDERLRNRPEFWRQKRREFEAWIDREFEAWVEKNNRPVDHSQPTAWDL